MPSPHAAQEGEITRSRARSDHFLRFSMDLIDFAIVAHAGARLSARSPTDWARESRSRIVLPSIVQLIEKSPRISSAV